MKTIKIGSVNINIHEGPLGVQVSGGADSAILLYILMQNATEPLHVYTTVSKEKHRTASHVAASVISTCMDLTNTSTVFHHLTYADSQTLPVLHTRPREDVKNKTVNIVYVGDTAVPPADVRAGFGPPSGVDDLRDPAVIRSYYSGDRVFYSPLTNIDKQAIAELYDILGVRDSLYPVTRSCESFTQPTGHCGECWWCKERQWGFGYLE
jgi:7-cyano-7-deazaguanine synthase in queuosine biosynthesis